MSEGTIFFFGWLNFTALVAVLAWGLRKVAREFFFARRMKLRQEMVQAARRLREARLRAASAAKSVRGIDTEIASRRKELTLRCQEACDEIAREAKRQGERIVENAIRQGHAERARAVAEMRTRLVQQALTQARGLLVAQVRGDIAARFAERGVAQFAQLLERTGGKA